MAPKGKGVKAVVTTRKVVEETVEVVEVVSSKEAPPPKGDDDDEEKRRATGKNEDGGVIKKRKRKRGGGGEGYKRYLFKVMKQVHPEMGISGKAITIINNLMVDMFERIAEEAARLQNYTGRRTMSSREIQGAVKLVLPGELGNHALAEGTKALTNYMSYISPTYLP